MRRPVYQPNQLRHRAGAGRDDTSQGLTAGGRRAIEQGGL